MVRDQLIQCLKVRFCLSQVSLFRSISSKNISCIHFFLYVVEALVVAVGYDGLACGFEFGEVVHYPASEEGRAVFEGRFVDDDLGTFSLYAFHNALDGALAEVV